MFARASRQPHVYINGCIKCSYLVSSSHISSIYDATDLKTPPNQRINCSPARLAHLYTKHPELLLVNISQNQRSCLLTIAFTRTITTRVAELSSQRLYVQFVLKRYLEKNREYIHGKKYPQIEIHTNMNIL